MGALVLKNHSDYLHSWCQMSVILFARGGQDSYQHWYWYQTVSITKVAPFLKQVDVSVETLF